MTLYFRPFWMMYPGGVTDHFVRTGYLNWGEEYGEQLLTALSLCGSVCLGELLVGDLLPTSSCSNHAVSGLSSKRAVSAVSGLI